MHWKNFGNTFSHSHNSNLKPLDYKAVSMTSQYWSVEVTCIKKDFHQIQRQHVALHKTTNESSNYSDTSEKYHHRPQSHYHIPFLCSAEKESWCSPSGWPWRSLLHDSAVWLPTYNHPPACEVAATPRGLAVDEAAKLYTDNFCHFLPAQNMRSL